MHWGDPGHSTPIPLKVRVKIWVSVLPFWLFETGFTAAAYARLAGSRAPGASSDLASYLTVGVLGYSR